MARTKKTIADIFGAWPPGIWVGSYREYDEIGINPDTAQLESARQSGKRLTISAKQGNRIALSSIEVENDMLLKEAVVVLSKSIGKTIRSIGDLEVEIQE